MEQLIQELNSPINQGDPTRINEIQKQIQHLQREKSAWQLGLDFLNHKDSTIRFYGALTLTIKINADWDKDSIGEDAEMRNHLLEALISAYVRLSNWPDSTFVLQKLCSTLAAYFERHNTRWANPLAHILACLLQERYIPQGQVPSMKSLIDIATRSTEQQMIAIVRMAAIMAEDLNSRSLKSSEADHLTNRLIDNTNEAWQVFRMILLSFARQNMTFSNGTIDTSVAVVSRWEGSGFLSLVQMVLQAMPGWVTFLKPKAGNSNNAEIQAANRYAKECVVVALLCIHHGALSGIALQTITTFVTASPQLLKLADPEFVQTISTSPIAEQWVLMLVSGDFDAEAVLFVDFLEAVMSQVDTTSSDYVISGRYQYVFSILQKLLRCEGVAVIEDTACPIAFEAVSQIAEGYTDWVDDENEAKIFIKSFIEEACVACLSKIKLPTNEMDLDTQTWDADDRIKFQGFRYDVQDFFQSAFVTLGTNLVQEIANTVLQSESEIEWSSFEAGIFSLTAFSDTMASNSTMYDNLIMAIFDSRQWRQVMQPTYQVPDRVRQTCIKFVAENTGYLQRHTEGLVTILNFLFSSLHLSSSASSASRAIYTLCDAQRVILVEALPQFLNSFSNIAGLNDIEQHRLYGSVASIIQALPNEDSKVEPLSQLLAKATQTVNSCLIQSPGMEVDLAQAVDVLRALAAIGRGLRVSADTPIDLDSPDGNDRSFWTEGRGSNLQKEVLTFYSTIMQRFVADSALTEASCDFIRSGLTETHPSPFKFESSISLDLISQQISIECPNIDAVMACASSLLASLAPNDLGEGLMKMLYPVTAGCRKVIAEFLTGGTLVAGSFPSAILDFMARMIPRWLPTWFASQGAENTTETVIELALLVLADADTLPRRSAASFFAALVDVSESNQSGNEKSQVILLHVLQSYAPRILGQVLRLLSGECARSELESLTEPLRRFTHRQPMLAKKVCKEVVKEENGILSAKALRATSIEQRLRFLAQVEGLRGARKTNEVVKDFWIACRGSGFEYIG